MAKTYAIFNPSDKGANISLSGGNLTATAGSLGWESVRSTIGKSSGKHYFEFVVKNSSSNSNPMLGVGLSTVPLTSYAGNNSGGYVYWDYNGNKVNSGSFTAYGADFGYNDVIGVAFDMDNGTITMYKNGTSQGTMFTGLSGTFYPIISINIGTGIAGVVLANFGASAFAYTPPTGYRAGIYTGEDDANASILCAII